MREPLANLALSNAVRPGVVGWLKTLAREVGPDGITVNTIAPGRIDTDRLRSLYGAGGSDVAPHRPSVTDLNSSFCAFDSGPRSARYVSASSMTVCGRTAARSTAPDSASQREVDAFTAGRG